MSERLPLRWLLTGGALGAAVMYLVDPERGARRRAMISDRGRASVHGVQDLAGKANRDLHNRAHGLAARAKGSPRPGRRTRTVLSRGTAERRLLEGGGGALLAVWGLGRGGLIGVGGVIAGASLVARAAMPRTADHLIMVQKTITIGAPIDEVFAFWSRFENFPRFMDHVLEVRATDREHSHWRVTGPAGVALEWDAGLIEMLPNRKIAWRSLEGSTVEHHGEVHFEAMEGGATRISVHMAYLPPAGALGHAVACFLHGDPKTLMDADLLRMKSLLETGKATAHHEEVHLDQFM